MAFEYTVSEVIPADAGLVFDALLDLPARTTWCYGVTKVERHDSGTLRVGSAWTETTQDRRKDVETTDYAIAALERPSRLLIIAGGPPKGPAGGNFRYEYRLSPAPGGTRVELHVNCTVTGVLGFVIGIARKGVQMKHAEQLRDFKTHMSRYIPPTQ